MSSNLDVILQFGIKALDAAERIRRASSDGRRSISNKAAGHFAFQSKQFEADEFYSSEVIELAVRVVATCVFNGFRRGASEAKESSQDLIPSTASMEAYVKRLRLARIIGKEDCWDVSEKNRRSNSFDDACDELMGLSTPNLSPEPNTSHPPVTPLDTVMTEASESVDQPEPLYLYADRNENINANDTPSTPYNRKRQGNSANPWRDISRSNSNENAEALSPSLSNLTNPKSISSSMRFLVPKRIQKSLYDDYSLCTDYSSQAHHGNDEKDEDMKSSAGESEGMTFLPQRKVLPCKLLQPPFSIPSPPKQKWSRNEDLESVLVMDEISDIMIRICFQLDNLASRRPNYYGIFNMQPLTAELGMLKRRLTACLDFTVTGKREPVACLRDRLGTSRNAPMEEEDFEKCADTMQPNGVTTYRYPLSLARSALLHDLPFRDVTGRIFWEDYCCDGNAVSSLVPWSRFAEAFERVYGLQHQSVMERFKDVLDGEAPKKATQPSVWNGTEESESATTGKNSIFRSSPRKKRRSHVTRWFRKSVMICPPLLTTDKNSSCEKCLDFPEDQQGNVSGSNKDANSSMVVSIEKFAKFCTDFGGLFEGFIAVTDPGTHIECLGTVEDLSKEELHNLGLFEETEDLVPEIEAEERSFIFKPFIIKELLGLQILQLSCGGQHAAILTEGGEVYTWGKGGFGRLGHGDTRPCLSPRKVALSHRCSQVACGFAYTALVTICGAVYSFGAGENGRLGVGDEHDRHRPTKVLVQSNVKVDSVYAGSVHTCILTVGGEVYSFGKHEYTGHGSAGDIYVPRKLDAFGAEKISQLSVGPGGYHTIALTRETRSVYTWGHNRVGQLGFPISEHSAAHEDGGYFVPKPTWVSSISHLKVAKVVAGWGHSALLTEDGAIYTCGRNFQGQLGSGQPDFSTVNERGHPYQCSFRPVKGDLSDVRITQLACGGEHSIALSEDGYSCYAFGKGHKGQLGLSSREARYVPTLITRYEQDRRQILEVACGNNCTLVLRGRYKVPSLFELCRVAVNPQLNGFSLDEMPLVRSILSVQSKMDCSN